MVEVEFLAWQLVLLAFSSSISVDRRKELALEKLLFVVVKLPNKLDVTREAVVPLLLQVIEVPHYSLLGRAIVIGNAIG